MCEVIYTCVARTKKREPHAGLKKLRKILGQTQKQFAALVGVSVPLVKMVESGQQPLAQKFNEAIRVATGASLWKRDGPVFGCPSAGWSPLPNGKIVLGGWGYRHPYTRKTFDWWQRHQTGKAAALEDWKQIAPILKRLYLVAAEPGVAGVKPRLAALDASLWAWVWKADEDFQLGLREEIYRQFMKSECPPED